MPYFSLMSSLRSGVRFVAENGKGFKYPVEDERGRGFGRCLWGREGFVCVGGDKVELSRKEELFMRTEVFGE